MFRLFSITMLVACTVDTLPLDQAAPPLTLTADNIEPGEDFTLYAEGANAGDRVYFVNSRQLGTTCLAVLGGNCLDITNPSVMGSAIAGPAGIATLTVPVPPNAPEGLTLHFQAGVIGSQSYLSNLVTRTSPTTPVFQPFDCPPNGIHVPTSILPTVSAAVSALDPINGGTICIDAGTHNRSMLDNLNHITIPVVVQGAGVDETIIGSTSFFQHNANRNITFRSMTIDADFLHVNVYNTTLEDVHVLGGLRLHGASASTNAASVTIRRSVFTEDNGDAINIRTSANSTSAPPLRVHIENSYLYGSSFGLNVQTADTAAQVTVDHSTIAGNRNASSGAALLLGSGQGDPAITLTLRHSIIADNDIGLRIVESPVGSVTVQRVGNAFFNDLDHLGLSTSSPIGTTDIFEDCVLDQQVPAAPSPGTACIDGAPNSTMLFDFWGRSRAVPDIGAVERN